MLPMETIMKIVPVIKSRDLQRSLDFYTEVLDFEHKWPGDKGREMANGLLTWSGTALNRSFRVIQETAFSAL